MGRKTGMESTTPKEGLAWSDYRNSGRAARVAIYARVSTTEQASGFSLDEQVARLRAFCGDKGGRCTRLFREVESGGTLERPKLDRLLGLAQQGTFDIVLVWKVDRLGRSNLDLQNVWAYLKELEVEVVSGTEPFDSTTPVGKALFDMLALMSEMERATIKDRAAMGALGRAKQGKWHGGPPPYGYVYDEKTGRLMTDEKEVDIVGYIVDLAIAKGELGTVVRRLRREGITTRRGKPWSKATVSRLIGNPIYVGLLRYKDVVTKDESLRVFDDETMSKLHARRSEWRRHRIARFHRPRGSSIPRDEWCHGCGFPLSGARAYCSNCGAAQWLPDVADEDPEAVPALPASEDPEGDTVT
jgi:site-specific DNA recombinase